MIYIFGQPPNVRMVGPQQDDPATGLPWLILVTDQTVRADTTINDVDIQLPPLASFAGRGLLVFNDGPNPGGFNANVFTVTNETFFDGTNEIIVGPGSSARITAG